MASDNDDAKRPGRRSRLMPETHGYGRTRDRQSRSPRPDQREGKQETRERVKVAQITHTAVEITRSRSRSPSPFRLERADSKFSKGRTIPPTPEDKRARALENSLPELGNDGPMSPGDEGNLGGRRLQHSTVPRQRYGGERSGAITDITEVQPNDDIEFQSPHDVNYDISRPVDGETVIMKASLDEKIRFEEKVSGVTEWDEPGSTERQSIHRTIREDVRRRNPTRNQPHLRRKINEASAEDSMEVGRTRAILDPGRSISTGQTTSKWRWSFNSRADKELCDEDKAKYQEDMRDSNVLRLPMGLCKNSLDDLVQSVGPKDGPCHCVLNLTGVQRLNLQALRYDIAKKVAAILGDETLDEAAARDLNVVMHQYCNALRDWDYMESKYNKAIHQDPFKLVSSHTRDAAILNAHKIPDLTSRRYPKVRIKWRKVASDFARPALLGYSRGYARESAEWKAFTRRLLWTLLGGLSLIGPTLLMVLHGGLRTTLATASACTVAFALVLALFSKESPLTLVGATAGYAAVMVVFIGTSSS